MSTAIACYLVAAALKLRFYWSNEQCVKEACDLWRLISERL